LRSVELIDVGLTDLEGFPRLPELQVLHLDQNPITTLAALPSMPKLDKIVLKGAQPGAEATVSHQPALRQVVTPEAMQRADPTPTPPATTVFPIEVEGGIIHAPSNPWVERIESHTGVQLMAKRRCTSSVAGDVRLDCTFSFGHLRGVARLPVSLGRGAPRVRATLQVGGGTARVYMPYFGVQEYVQAHGGGEPVALEGALQPVTRGSSDGDHELVVHAPESATDVVIRLTAL
jgi:hypothetical protein